MPKSPPSALKPAILGASSETELPSRFGQLGHAILVLNRYVFRASVATGTRKFGAIIPFDGSGRRKANWRHCPQSIKAGSRTGCLRRWLGYLALKALELRQLVAEGNRDHTFLAIEEPEAHLHPHLQRLVYRDFLKPRLEPAGPPAPGGVLHNETNRTVFLTTHSPHIVSVTPVRSLVLFRKADDGLSTEGASTAETELDPKDVADIERYLDVTRGEIVFSRAVLLVEGDAECFAIPILAKLMGHDLDELGISVCSVSGTNFAPYVKLLGEAGLKIPYAVLTDYDPTDKGGSLGVPRVKALLELIIGEEPRFENDAELLKAAMDFGLFVNDHTFEVDLFRSGRHKSMCATIVELTENGPAEKRALAWKQKPESLDTDQMLKDIEAIGKGRFAQRLASRLYNDICPQYIRDAVKFLADKCT